MRRLIRLAKRVAGVLGGNLNTLRNFTVIVGSTHILFEAHVFQNIGEKCGHPDQKISRFEIRDEQGRFDRSIEVWGPHEVQEI